MSINKRPAVESSSNAPITNDIIRTIHGLHKSYPNEGGADLGRRLAELFKPHQINLALSNLTDRHAWAMSEEADAVIMNAQTLVGRVLNDERAEFERDMKNALAGGHVTGLLYDEMFDEWRKGRKTTDDEAEKVPTLERNDWDTFSLLYDDIEVIVDRANGDSDVEVRIWRNGKNEDYPFAKVNFDLTEGDKDDDDSDDAHADAIAKMEARGNISKIVMEKAPNGNDLLLFDSNINIDTGSAGRNISQGTMRSEMELFRTDGGVPTMIEWTTDDQDADLGANIGLEVDGLNIIGYDGVFEVGEEVWDWLEYLGYKVADDLRTCDAKQGNLRCDLSLNHEGSHSTF